MLEKIVKDYETKKIDKDEYIMKAFEIHKELMNYPLLLKKSFVERVEIDSNGVYLVININSHEIKMKMNSADICDVSTILLNFGEYENQELGMVLKILSYLDKDSVVFDIGANLGWYSLNFLSDNSAYRCYTFEPVEQTYKKMVENFKCNKFNTNNVYNFGFYNENKEVKFYFNSEESGASSLANLRENGATVEITCMMKRLDDFIAEHNVDRIDFIKCDVEGSELFVYQGGLEAISKYKPIVFSEMLRKWCRKFNYHPNDIISLFKKLGYECFVISTNQKLKRIAEVTEETVETNYFFLHKEKHQNIIQIMLGEK